MDSVTFASLGFHAWLTIGVVVALFVCLAREWFSPDVILVGAVAVLLLGGVLNPAQALAGFSNQAVLTVAVLFILVAALRSTGAIRWIAAWVLGRPHGAFIAQGRLVGVSSALSAFINNTPVVAMLTAAVENWACKAKIPVSKLLIPLSYATILGGMCTLIGTSTNLVVLGLMQEQTNLPGLSMFDPAWVGIPAAIVGGLYLLTIGRWLLPDRRTALDQARETREYVLEMRVAEGSKLIGRDLVAAGLRRLSGAFVVEIQRAYGSIRPAVNPDAVLQANDRLVFVGTAAGLREVRQVAGLVHVEDQVFQVGEPNGRHFVEVVMARLSPVVGHTIRAAHFRDRYGAAVVAINRRGKQLARKPGDVVLQAGDTLLLETIPEFTREFATARDFAMVHLIDDTPAVQPGKAMTAIGILVAMVLANVLLRVDIFESALLAALAALVTGCVSWRDARRAIDYPLVIAIACAFAIGLALSRTGVAAAVAGVLMHLGAGDPFWTLVLIYALTSVFTELLTNNASAVLMFPIGLAAATGLGVNPMPFIMAVMIGASASFITPIGYQTNMMVYGPGGYRFMDYVKVGTPLSILVGAVVLLIVPHVWPF